MAKGWPERRQRILEVKAIEPLVRQFRRVPQRALVPDVAASAGGRRRMAPGLQPSASAQQPGSHPAGQVRRAASPARWRCSSIINQQQDRLTLLSRTSYFCLVRRKGAGQHGQARGGGVPHDACQRAAGLRVHPQTGAERHPVPLYREVLAQELPWLAEIGRPPQRKRIPAALT
jgi:hypothetical protein